MCGTCQKRIVTKDWTGRKSWICGRHASYITNQGQLLCAGHRKKLVAKLKKRGIVPNTGLMTPIS